MTSLLIGYACGSAHRQDSAAWRVIHPGLAVLATPRAATTSWHLGMSKAPPAAMGQTFRPDGTWPSSPGGIGASPASLAANGAPQLADFSVDAHGDHAPWALLRAAVPAGVPLALDRDARRHGPVRVTSRWLSALRGPARLSHPAHPPITPGALRPGIRCRVLRCRAMPCRAMRSPHPAFSACTPSCPLL